MKYTRFLALILSLLMVLAPLAQAGEMPGPEILPTPTAGEPGPEVTPTATPEPTPTQTPEATPAQTPEPTATHTPEPTATNTAEPTPVPTPEATPTQTPEVTPTPAPQATATALPQETPGFTLPALSTPVPQYPKMAYDPASVYCDVNQATQGGYVLVALPIGYQESQGVTIWSHTRGSVGGSWTMEAAPAPGYFNPDFIQYVTEAVWAVEGENFELEMVFDMSAGSTRDIIARAPKNNDWNMVEGTPYNAGYALFRLPIREDAPGGTYTMKFEFVRPDMESNRYDDMTFTMRFSLRPPALPVETPTQAPTQQPTSAPGGDDDWGDDDWGDDDWGDDDWGDDEPDAPTSMGSVMVGQTAVKTVKVRQQNVTLAVPVSYVLDNVRIYSNHDDSGAVVEAGQGWDAYSQDIAGYIDWMEISVSAETAASGEFPFDLTEQGGAEVVIADGVNYGYAQFKGLTVKRNLSNGTMAVPLTVRWIESGSDSILTGNLSVLVNITGASTGGGGGGGYTAPTTPPQAKVLIESLTTDPAEVKAGDTFDIIMKLRNTSAGQYVQNMRVTISSEEDMLIPLSGSNTLYIDRIDKDSVYELRYPVRANMQVPDHPIRVDVSLEYEDSSVAAQNATQSLMVNVAENRRVKVDEPVLDNVSPMAGDTVTASMQVINEGRTMLYNVTVVAQSENENLLLPVSSYLGNMEGGTSKKAEMDLIPVLSGEYQVNFQITYEDALGVPYTETRTASFFASEEPSYDDYYGGGYYDDYSSGADDYEVEGPALDAQGVMQLLPWWIYAMSGGILVLLVLMMGLSARSKHRKALEDDEMD